MSIAFAHWKDRGSKLQLRNRVSSFLNLSECFSLLAIRTIPVKRELVLTPRDARTYRSLSDATYYFIKVIFLVSVAVGVESL